MLNKHQNFFKKKLSMMRFVILQMLLEDLKDRRKSIEVIQSNCRKTSVWFEYYQTSK